MVRVAIRTIGLELEDHKRKSEDKPGMVSTALLVWVHSFAVMTRKASVYLWIGLVWIRCQGDFRWLSDFSNLILTPSGATQIWMNTKYQRFIQGVDIIKLLKVEGYNFKSSVYFGCAMVHFNHIWSKLFSAQKLFEVTTSLSQGKAQLIFHDCEDDVQCISSMVWKLYLILFFRFSVAVGAS